MVGLHRWLLRLHRVGVMRLKGVHMTRLLVISFASVAAIVLGVVVGSNRTNESRSDQRAVARHDAVSVVRDAPKLPWVKPGTQEFVGELETQGRKIRLETVESTDGEDCLVDIEIESGVSGATCSRGGLFSAHKVVFSVNFDGGPEHLSSLSVIGLAAPGIASVGLGKSDGSVVRVALDRTRGFVIESPPSELEMGVTPTGLVLFGPSGKRVDEVGIPDLRER